MKLIFKTFSILMLFIFFSCDFFTGESGSSSGSKDSSDPVEYNYITQNQKYDVLIHTTILLDEDRGWSEPGPNNGNVHSCAMIIHDTREIPIKIYLPESDSGRFPLLILSHGLGGNRETKNEIATYLASYGYIVVAVQHHGSDNEFFMTHGFELLQGWAGLGETKINRPKDVSYVLDDIEDGGLIDEDTGVVLLDANKVDFDRIGVFGHSFGSFTTLTSLGMKFDYYYYDYDDYPDNPNRTFVQFSDDRIKCGIGYSPQGIGALGSYDVTDNPVYDMHGNSWDQISKPVLTMFGTEDISPGTEDPLERKDPFLNMPATSSKYNVIFDGATHGDFGNPDSTYYEWVLQLTIAFFDSNLLESSYAAGWLNNHYLENVTSLAEMESK